MRFPLEKYTFHTYKMSNGAVKTVAASTYAGKPVYGVAKCSPEDKYDENIGRGLAAARCNAKVAKLRKKAAYKKLVAARRAYEAAKKEFYNMHDYWVDASDSLIIANDELSVLEKIFGSVV